MMEEGIKMDEGETVNSDSRKRPLDLEVDDAVAKKSHSTSDHSNEGTCHLKILVPSIAAGAIIGKGGETIAQLQKDTNARVKMSKANDFYPGTSERVCLINGNVESIVKVLSFIMEKIKEKPETNSKSSSSNDADHKSITEREKQMKILIPNTTAGMIIGKGGAYIKQIKEESGAYIQISQKAKDQSLAERCITIIASDTGQLKMACEMILSKVAEDPQSGSCLNISYSDVNGPVANPNPTGSPFANPASGHSTQIPGNFNSALSPLSAGLGSLLGGGLNLTINLNSAFAGGGVGNPFVTGQLLDHVRAQLRASGFPDQSNGEVCQAIAALINYGIIGLGFGPHNSGAGNALLGNGPGMVPNCDSFHGSSGLTNGNNGPFGPIGTTVASSGLSLGGQSFSGPGGAGMRGGEGLSGDSHFDPFRRQSTTEVNSNLVLNSNSFGLGTPLRRKSPSPTDLSGSGSTAAASVAAGNTKKDVEVGEHIVGAILGPGGKALVEIQHMSGTSIQISKKGNYAPGTKNRVVTITGLPSGISTAQYLIEQRIAEEESKRARQTAAVLGGPVA